MKTHLHANTASAIAACGRKGYGLAMTWKPEEVTCTKCLKAIGKKP